MRKDFLLLPIKLLILIFIVTAVSCSSNKEIKHGDLVLHVNDKMQFKINSGKEQNL